MNTRKIIKYTGIFAASNLALLLTPVSGATVTFADWQSSGVDHNNSSSETATLTQDGVTFTLTIESVGDGAGNVAALTGQGDRLGVRNGLSNAHLDSRDTVADGVDTANDEALKFTLTVTGATLDSLSLASFGLSAWGLNEKLSFNDGTTAFDNTYATDDTGDFNYVGGTSIVAMTGLTVLNIANVGGQGDNAWELTVFARDKIAGGATTSTDFGVDDISFDYMVIPEPSMVGALFGFVALGCVLRRRSRR